MAYGINTSDVTSYGDFVSSDDDALIGGIITRAIAIVEEYTGRVFEASSDIKKFDAELDVDGRTLFLNSEDLVSVTSIINGDSDAGDITSSDYVLEPRNVVPKFAITLRAASTAYWSQDTDSNNVEAISVDGKWGYSASPPADIKQAVIRLTLWLYKQRSTEIELDRPLLTNDGVTILPSRWPGDVMSILNQYKKYSVSG